MLRLCVLFGGLSVILPLSAMESVVALPEDYSNVLGGISITAKTVDIIVHQDQLIACKEVMRAVMHGMELKGNELMLRELNVCIPLETASSWIDQMFQLAERIDNEGTAFVTSSHPSIRACQAMLEKLWRFATCVDLQDMESEEAQHMYNNRIIRITALINLDLQWLKEYAQVPVILPKAEPASVAKDIDFQFQQSQVRLRQVPALAERANRCFACLVRKKNT
ncbi:MAG: hypothetical protein AB7F19_01345 [Candidatus Babeliales bacterium]